MNAMEIIVDMLNEIDGDIIRHVVGDSVIYGLCSWKIVFIVCEGKTTRKLLGKRKFTLSWGASMV